MLTCCCPADADLTSDDPVQRNNGVEFMKRIIDGTVELGSKKIGGIVYSVWPHKFDNDMITPKIKYEHTQFSIESMRKIAPTAENCGIFLNTAEEGVTYCKTGDSGHIKLLMDVFHMNMGEESFEEAFQTARGYIGHVHVSEANR